MKPIPAPEVPGNTPWEKLDNAVRKVFTVSKDDLLKAEVTKARQRGKTRRSKKRPEHGHPQS